jgi:hypothetical protein
MSAQFATACTTPTKHKYLDEATARAQAATLGRPDDRSGRGGWKARATFRPYKCPAPCPFWHLSTHGTRQ